MKPFKMLGLAVLVALLTMAFAGAGSAMAESTALCKEDVVLLPGEVCPAGKLISHVHEVSIGNGLLLTSIVNAKCPVLYLGDVTSANNLGNPLEILGHFTYPMAGCETTTGILCEVTETSTHAIYKILKLGHELGDGTEAYEVNWHCGSVLNCTYDGTGVLSHWLGPLLSGENHETRISEQTLTKTGGLFCPKTAKLDVNLNSLEPTYIAK